MILDILKSIAISAPVGNNMDNDPADVKAVKTTLYDQGYDSYDTDNTDEPHGIFTRKTDTAIRDYQTDRGLRTDGFLRPKGETETAMNDDLATASQNTYAIAMTDDKDEYEADETATADIAPLTPAPLPPAAKPMINRGMILEVLSQSKKNEKANASATTSNTQFNDWLGDLMNGLKTMNEEGKGNPESNNAENKSKDIETKIPPVPERKPEYKKPAEDPFDKKMRDFIAGFESSDNYNVIVGGEEKPLTTMTINEVRELQKDMSKSKKYASDAVGRYQIIESTMDYLMRRMSLDGTEIFDEKMQDEMATNLLRRRGIEKYKKGEMTAEEFIFNISKEWAALPKDSSNISYHDKVGNNKALIDYETLIKIVESIYKQ